MPVPQPSEQPADDRDLEQINDVSALKTEAATRRRQARELTAQRDQLEVQRNAAERRLVAHLAADRLADPTDWTDGLDLDALRGEDGAINDERIDEALAELLTNKPHWSRAEPTPPPAMPNLHQGAMVGRVAEDPPSVGEVFRRAAGR